MTKQAKQSAGLLMFRKTAERIEVLLVHPGGPYWVNKDEGSWTVPKGEYGSDEEPLDAAKREFQEETGFSVREPFFKLGSVRQKSGKVVQVWAFEGDCDPSELVSNTCEVQWPPRSGKLLVIPEIDRGAWYSLAMGAIFIRDEQRLLLTRLKELLQSPS